MVGYYWKFVKKWLNCIVLIGVVKCRWYGVNFGMCGVVFGMFMWFYLFVFCIRINFWNLVIFVIINFKFRLIIGIISKFWWVWGFV